MHHHDQLVRGRRDLAASAAEIRAGLRRRFALEVGSRAIRPAALASTPRTNRLVGTDAATMADREAHKEPVMSKESAAVPNCPVCQMAVGKTEAKLISHFKLHAAVVPERSATAVALHLLRVVEGEEELWPELAALRDEAGNKSPLS